MRGSGGGGGAGGLDPIGKSHVIWVDLDLNPLPLLTKIPGSAHGGGQFISLECIRADCLMEDQARGRGGGGGCSIPARGLRLAENDGFHMTLIIQRDTKRPFETGILGLASSLLCESQNERASYHWVRMI